MLIKGISASVVTVPEQVDYHEKCVAAMEWLRDEAKCDAVRATLADRWLRDNDAAHPCGCAVDGSNPCTSGGACHTGWGSDPAEDDPDEQEAWEREYRRRVEG